MSADLHVTHHVKGVKLGPKLGPFPAVVWVLIIAAGLYVAHRRAASSAASTAASTDTTSATDTTSSTGTDVPAGASSDVPLEVVGGGAGVPASNAGAPVSDAAPIDVQDNVSWQSAAIRALIKAGVTPITANNAVDRYLSGDMLTAEEAHAVNVALSLIGPPPEGAPPVNVAPAGPAPTPVVPRPTNTPAGPTAPGKPASHKHRSSAGAPRPSRGGRVTVHPGDTLTAIAAAHGVAEPELYSRNRGTIEAAAHAHGRKSSESGHWIYPGTVLVLP